MSEPTPSASNGTVYSDDDFIEFEQPSLFLSVVFPLVLLVCAFMLYFEQEIPILANIALAGTRRYHTAACLMLVGLATLIHIRTFWDSQRDGRWYVLVGYTFGFICMLGCATIVILKFLRMT